MKGLVLKGIFLEGLPTFEKLLQREANLRRLATLFDILPLMGHSSFEKILLVYGELLMKRLLLTGIFLKGLPTLKRLYSGEANLRRLATLFDILPLMWHSSLRSNAVNSFERS